MSKFRTTILAAVTLFPTLASAQMPPAPDGGNRPNARYDRPAPPPVPVQAAPQGQAPRPDGGGRPDRPQGDFRNRGDRGGFNGGDMNRDQARDDRGGFDRRDGQVERWQTGDGRRDFAPGEPTPGRPRDDRGRYDGRGDDRGRYDGRGYDDRRGREDGRRYGDGRNWNGGRYDGRGWNNGWRNDRRYDWQGWRNSNRGLFRGPRYYAPRGYSYRAFGIGYRLDSFFYGQNYWINDPYQYRLPPAEGPYRWVRYYNDVLLVDLRTGIVVDAIRGFFW